MSESHEASISHVISEAEAEAGRGWRRRGRGGGGGAGLGRGGGGGGAGVGEGGRGWRRRGRGRGRGRAWLMWPKWPVRRAAYVPAAVPRAPGPDRHETAFIRQHHMCKPAVLRSRHSRHRA